MITFDMNRAQLLGQDVVNTLGDKRVYLYGICPSLFLFEKNYGNQLNIVGYVDNGFKGNVYNGRTVIGGDELKQIRKDEIIVITATLSALSIADSLLSSGFKEKTDFYIFDSNENLCFNETINKYIELNRSAFQRTEGEKEGIVLVPCWKAADANIVILSYVSNYLADKFNACIKACVREGKGINTITQPVRAIYESFGTNEIIQISLSEEQKKTEQRLLDQVFPKIKTIDDWHDITLFGVNVGTTIVQTYLRYSNYIHAEYDENNWREAIRRGIRDSIFWHDYLDTHDIKCVVLTDHGNDDGYLRDYATAIGIPVYAIHHDECKRLTTGFSHKYNCAWYKHYADFWEQLSDEEREIGIKYAKEEIGNRLSGKKAYGVDISPYSLNVSDSRILKHNDKLKVLICPHIFDEETIHSGWQLFKNYVSWLNHLALLSEKTDYDWYIKIHPMEGIRGKLFFKEYLSKHKNITLVPNDATPRQLAAEGIKFAFTVCGSIGQEYPLLGIKVINAGNNPHIAFNFNYHPRTVKEFDELVYSLADHLDDDISVEELYKFYAIHFLFYKNIRLSMVDRFFLNPQIRDYIKSRSNRSISMFLAEWTEKRHDEILNEVKKLIKELDEFKADYFYKNVL